MRFYLGTDIVSFLWNPQFKGVPLFVSARRLRSYKRLRPSVTDWALDSGGFSTLSLFGRWEVGAEQYVSEVERFATHIGRLQFAAPQDWMCEELVCASVLLEQGRIKSDRGKFRALVEKFKPASRTPERVRTCAVLACLPLDAELWRSQILKHQRYTVANYLELTGYAPSLPFIPVLQGYRVADYLRHAADYARAGVRLERLPLVGVGSVCRRQSSAEGVEIIRAVRSLGIRPHGFGFKKEGIRAALGSLESADSMAWCYAGWRTPLPECKGSHRNCAHCPRFALKWRQQIVSEIESGKRKAFDHEF